MTYTCLARSCEAELSGVRLPMETSLMLLVRDAVALPALTCFSIGVAEAVGEITTWAVDVRASGVRIVERYSEIPLLAGACENVH